MLRKSGEPEIGVSEPRASVHPTDVAAQIESTDRTSAAVRAQRWTGVVKWISAALIVIALFVIIRGAATVREPLRRNFSEIWNKVGPKSVVVLVWPHSFVANQRRVR